MVVHLCLLKSLTWGKYLILIWYYKILLTPLILSIFWDMDFNVTPIQNWELSRFHVIQFNYFFCNIGFIKSNLTLAYANFPLVALTTNQNNWSHKSPHITTLFCSDKWNGNSCSWIHTWRKETSITLARAWENMKSNEAWLVPTNPQIIQKIKIKIKEKPSWTRAHL